MALTYNSWFASVFNAVAAVSTATPIDPLGTLSSYTDPFWQLELPNLIDAGEERCFRDLDLLNWRVTDVSAQLTLGQRSFNLPTANGTFRSLEQINVVGTSSDVTPAPVRHTLVPVSRAYLDMEWPSQSTGNGMPEVYAMQNDRTVLLGPAPDANYPVECIGPQKPTPLSIGNQTTFLSVMLPDLFFAATMIRATMYMRDLGVSAGNPAMGVNWEAQYNILLKSASIEEAARWYRSLGWTSQKPQPTSTPPRV